MLLFFFFAWWKAGRFSIAFLRSNGKSYYYSEQEKFWLFFINFPEVAKFDPWYLARKVIDSFEIF